jgi:DNA invertase Pin-like site-specific DNA recombinase
MATRRSRTNPAQPSSADRAAVGYLRRSTDRQEQSIPDQQRAIERYAAEQGLTVQRWYTDDAISGTSVAGRKAFQQLIADAQLPSCPFRYVICYDVKRFGRVDNDEAGYYRHILKAHGVEVLYASEGFAAPGMSCETDDLLRPVKQWQARQESKDLSKVTIRGLLSRSEGGWWMGGVPPLGYDLAYESDRGEHLFTVRQMPDGSKQILDASGSVTRTLLRGESLSISKRDRARLVPGDPDRVAVVQRIFTMYVEDGKGLTTIASALNADGVPTVRNSEWSAAYRHGQRFWADSTVRAILVNPLYVGDMVWNRRTDARFHMIAAGRAVERKAIHGVRLEPNDECDWIVIRDAHPPLIRREVFERARAIREGHPSSVAQLGNARPVSGGWNGARSRFALSGLVRCACCGARYQGVTRAKGTPKRDGTLVRTFSYACGAYIAKGTTACQFNPVGKDDLESVITDAVLAYYARYEGDAGKTLLVEAVGCAMDLKAGDLIAARKRAESEHAQVEATIANLLDNLTPSTRDLVEHRLTTLREQRDALARRLEEIQRLAAEEKAAQEAAHDIAKFLASLDWTLRNGLGEERLTALRRCIERVVVDKPAGSAVLHIRPLPAPSLARIPAEALTLVLPRTNAGRPSTKGAITTDARTNGDDPPGSSGRSTVAKRRGRPPKSRPTDEIGDARNP